MSRLDLHAPTEPGHLWVCSAAISVSFPALSCDRRYAGAPGYEQFVTCGFHTVDYDQALEHADDHSGVHWVYELFGGDWNRTPRRSMHGSDYGGVYVADGSIGWRRP